MYMVKVYLVYFVRGSCCRTDVGDVIVSNVQCLVTWFKEKAAREDSRWQTSIFWSLKI